jgi:hypothetical protein
LAALTIANGWRLVSVDRDFERFDGLERLPLPSPHPAADALVAAEGQGFAATDVLSALTG